MRINIRHNDKWACYSTVTDCFITYFLELPEYEAWRTEEYGEDKTPLEKSNIGCMEEILPYICANKTYDEIKESMNAVEFDVVIESYIEEGNEHFRITQYKELKTE